MLNEELATNKKAWDQVAKKYQGACALPVWGPFGECAKDDLLGSLTDKTVLEIGCGSGHSIFHAAEHGARKVYGVDISTAQIALTRELNRAHIEANRVQVFEAPMEEKQDLQDIDIIFSIYALGWVREPRTLFQNLSSYLKPGGRLVWSWEHPLFSRVEYDNGKLFVRDSYRNEDARLVENWSGSEGAYIQTRTIASWFHYLSDAGFMVRRFLEPLPEAIPEAAYDPSKYYSIAKASKVPCTMVFVCEKTGA